MAQQGLHIPGPRGLSDGSELEASRRNLLWFALGLTSLLGLAFVLVIAYGQEILSNDLTEPLLLIGLLAMLTCTVAYFADKDRVHRSENRRLVRRLKETAEALDARVERLNKLCETSTLLAGNLDIEHISDLVVEALVAQVQADSASLVLEDRATGERLHTRSVGTLADAASEPSSPDAVARAASLDAGPAIRSLDPAFGQRIEAWGKVRAAISAPLKVSDVLGGALAAIRQDSFNAEDINLLTTLANMASKAIESAELHEQLRQSYFRTLHVLARSLAARDPYSAAHGEAVTAIACRLAEALSLDAPTIQALRAYGPLHDLGKIGIPDSVLLKQGPLTQEQMEMCRQHTAIGEEIIKPLNPGHAVLSMIRSHHEAWNGSGYPDSLRADQIPILARIVAVADAFHAMTSHRSYRPGTSPFKALQEIETMSGTQFDPRVAGAMRALWENGELAKLGMAVHEAVSPERAPSENIPPLPVSLQAPPPAYIN